MKKVSTYEKNRRVSPFFSFLTKLISFFVLKFEKAKIVKIGRIPKPPYLMICSHASFFDFFVAVQATKPYRPHWVSTIEEFRDNHFVFRKLGVIAKRKFTNDPKSAQLMLDVLKNRKKILIIYPEARYSFVGQPERLDKGLAKLAKNADVPIVLLKSHGNYLREPQWGDRKHRKVSNMYSEMKCIISKKYVEQLTVDEIQEVIEDNFKFDEETFQLENNVKITYPDRAKHIERILYKCPHCGKEFEMSSEGTTFGCDACGAKYSYNEDGTISCLTGESKFTKISDWYKWEKECVKKEVRERKFYFEDDVRCEHLAGLKEGFVPMDGKFHMTMSIDDGIKVTSDTGFVYTRSSLQSYAIHIEYNYKGRGDCFDLSTNTETYFVYPLTKEKWLTKIHFATEIIYDYLKESLKNQ